MIKLEYFNGTDWVAAGGPFGNEAMAWVSLGGDDVNYRTVDAATGKVLTDKSKQQPEPKVNPCPFCGNVEIDSTDTAESSGGTFSIFCCDCECTGPLRNTKELAVVAWNDNSLKQNTELKADLQRVINEAGELLKECLKLVSQNNRLRDALKDVADNQHGGCPGVDSTIDILLKETTTQSLNMIEAGGIKKAVHELNLDNVSITMLLMYAGKLEEH